jgi:GPH family glycoside/pentoside/hexuronide:cation symporter
VTAPSRPAQDSPPPLSRSTRLWYAFGQFAEGIKNECFALFLLFYYTAVLGLSGVLAGQAILIALLFDAVTDPLVGTFSDRLRSRWGRRHPFLYAAAVPLGFCFYFAFAPPPGLSQLELFAWLATFAVLTRGAMTLFHVPHLALGAELSSDYEERTWIVTLQFIFTRVGHGVAALLALLWFMRPAPDFPNGRFNPAAYPEMAATFAVLMVVAILLSAWRTQDRIPYLEPPDSETHQRGVLARMFGDLFDSLRNVSFRALFVGLMFTYIAWGVSTALGLHLATYFWFASNAQLVVWGIFAGVGIFVGLPFWARVASRIDKKPTFIRGLAIFTVFTALPPFLKLAGIWPPLGHGLYVPLWAITTGFAAHFGVAAAMVTGRSMMADVTDEDALAHGRRREGIFFGAISFSAKASFGVGSQFAGFVVDAVGLVPNLPAAEVAPEVVEALGLTLGVSILVFCGASLFIFSRYQLDRVRHAEIQAALRELRASA